ncbi:hypothetical protein CWI39_1113p0030 [Hamiltosporidium magnivora]|uniref:Uncharacterized protein n=1 Tax=Hamiltosporidium magnivora TaxID=148818 RepID=A0A4Q9L515_9MICR|nr:hypothetical protein CWI36_1147p0010 [Hamiltosporidium magnivora]TBU02648.1 hypothetical protein CWI39_1113p0030 [Hamiltosporidium magnivora]
MIIFIVESTLENGRFFNTVMPDSDIVDYNRNLHHPIVRKNIDTKDLFTLYKNSNDLWIKDIENKVKKSVEKIESNVDTDFDFDKTGRRNIVPHGIKKGVFSEFEIYEYNTPVKN